jgi:hypothetical protein
LDFCLHLIPKLDVAGPLRLYHLAASSCASAASGRFAASRLMIPAPLPYKKS